ncbi:hypothetical protein [Spiroplasma ixodetis]|uniref:hypothetical protein n=1 Tax=Spiroplasma ixodetis TaxID=2141 RepID=UPI0025774AEA|nr:hypothetical protein [Spiroplasma ixodetis]WJG70892.1 hypothetical protein SIXOD_v1c21770 [Spiroplasma ixodetis Y32]
MYRFEDNKVNLSNQCLGVNLTNLCHEELSNLNKDFPHLFNNKKDTNISNSLDVKDKFKEEKNDEVDTRKIEMVG